MTPGKFLLAAGLALCVACAHHAPKRASPEAAETEPAAAEAESAQEEPAQAKEEAKPAEAKPAQEKKEPEQAEKVTAPDEAQAAQARAEPDQAEGEAAPGQPEGEGEGEQGAPEVAESTSAPAAESAVPEGRARLDALLNQVSLGEKKVRTEDLLIDDRPGGGEARNSLFSYMEGDNMKAVLMAQAAVGADPDNETRQALLLTLSRATGISIDSDGLLPLPALVQYELRRAEVAFFDQRYGAAIQSSRRALLLDPKNSMAWQRLGSAHYALGQEKEAKEAYKRALELEPNDFHLRVFMAEKGWK